MDFIEKLQKKPKAVRRNILYITTFLLTGIIVLFWVLTFQYRYSSNSDKEKRDSLQEDFVKPFSLLKESASEAYKGISEGISNVREGLRSE